MANGRMEKWMELEYVGGLMVLNIQVNGKIVRRKGKELWIFQMEVSTKDNLKMISLMDKEKKHYLMVVIMKVVF